MGVFSSSLSAKDAHQSGLKAIPGPGVRGKMKNGSRASNQMGEPSPFHQKEAEKGVRGQGGSALLLLIPSTRSTNPSYVKWSKKAYNIYMGP